MMPCTNVLYTWTQRTLEGNLDNELTITIIFGPDSCALLHRVLFPSRCLNQSTVNNVSLLQHWLKVFNCYSICTDLLFVLVVSLQWVNGLSGRKRGPGTHNIRGSRNRRGRSQPRSVQSIPWELQKESNPRSARSSWRCPRPYSNERASPSQKFYSSCNNTKPASNSKPLHPSTSKVCDSFTGRSLTPSFHFIVISTCSQFEQSWGSWNC